MARRVRDNFDQNVMFCSQRSDDDPKGSSESDALDDLIKRHAVHMPAGSGYTGDDVAETLIGFTGTRVSDAALEMGKEVIKRHKEEIDLSIVAYAMDLIDTRFGMADCEHEKLRVSKLLASWLSSTPVQIIDRADIAMKLKLLEPFVSSDEAYGLCTELVSSQSTAPTPNFADDLVALEHCIGIYYHLPVQVQHVVKDIAAKGIRHNIRTHTFVDRRRYDYLYNIIYSMRLFTRKSKDKGREFLHHPAVYDLAHDLMEKDRKNIIYPFYTLLGRVSRKTPDHVLSVIGDIVDYIPENCASEDEEFVRASRFMNSLLRFRPEVDAGIAGIASNVWRYMARNREPEEEDEYVIRSEEKKAFSFMDCLLKFDQELSPGITDVLSGVWVYLSKDGDCAVVPQGDVCDRFGSRFDEFSGERLDREESEDDEGEPGYCETLIEKGRINSPEYLFINRLLKLNGTSPHVVGLAGKVWEHMVSEDEPFPHRVNVSCRFLDYLSTVPSDVPMEAVGVVESFWDILRYYPEVDPSVVQRGYSFLTRMLGTAKARNPEVFSIASVVLDSFVHAEELDYQKLGYAHEMINKVLGFDSSCSDELLGLVGKVAGFVSMEADFDAHYCRIADLFLSSLQNSPHDVSARTLKLAEYVWEYISTAEIDFDEDARRRIRSYMCQLWKLPSNSGRDLSVVGGIFWDIVSAGFSRMDYSVSDMALGLFSSMPAKLDDNVRDLTESILNHTFNSIDDMDEEDLRRVRSYISFLWKFPEGVPKIVTNVASNIWDLMVSEDGVSEKGIYDCGFMRSLSKALEVHELYEIAAFFHLYQNLSLSSESQFAARNARNLQSLLVKSTKERQRAIQAVAEPDEGLSLDYLTNVLERRKQRKLEHRISEIGLEYLLLSGMLDYAETNPNYADPKRHFADAVVNMNSLPFDTSWVLENMWLYDKGILLRSDNLPDVEEEERLNNTVEILSVRQSHLRQVDRELHEIHDRGPRDCEEPLRSYLEKKFRRPIRKVWDLRLFQDRLYMSSSSVQAFSPLSDEIDVAAMRNTVDVMRRMRLVEPKLYYLAGACGFGFNEIEFCLAMEGRGYKVRMDMNDVSPRMRGRAMTNARRRGITTAEPYSKDVKKLTFEDLKGVDRQAVLSLHGKVWWNWPDRLEWLDRIWSIYAQRDATDPDSHYLLRRHDGSFARKKDLLLIQGRKKQNYHYYASELSKLFLARGLEGGFNLTMDALMRGDRLQHTLFYDRNNMELQCVYLVTKDCGRFKEDHAILVIDTGTLHEKILSRQLGEHGFSPTFVDGRLDTTIAICEWFYK